MDFEVDRFTPKCAATERELQPGDAFYSVLIPAGSKIERRDYLASAWPGAPEDAVCWWRSEMPASGGRKIAWAPNEAILEYFLELQKSGTEDTLYVLALLMVRRRLLRWEETTRDDDGREWMLLYSASNETEYRVLVLEPQPQRIAEIESELGRLLFASAE